MSKIKIKVSLHETFTGTSSASKCIAMVICPFSIKWPTRNIELRKVKEKKSLQNSAKAPFISVGSELDQEWSEGGQ